MENELMIVECSIKKWEESLIGVLLSQNNNVICMVNNPVDYLLDGYLFINRDKVKKVDILENSTSTQRVMYSKTKEYLNLNLNEYSSFTDFQKIFEFIKDSDIFCELRLSKEDTIYIGKVVNVKEKSIDIDFYDTEFQLMDNAFVKYKDITSVIVFSDYATTIERGAKNIW